MASDAGDTPHRQRAKRACEPCRSKKRKCDGFKPCFACRRYEYDCYYEDHSRKRPRYDDASPDSNAEITNFSPPTQTSHTIPRGPKTQAFLDVTRMRYMEANSGVALPRLLGMKLNPENAPRLHSFAWNLGIRDEPRYTNDPITKLIALDDAQIMAKQYFGHLHLLYGFVDKEKFEEKILWRYNDPASTNDYDCVIAGVVALGSLFSGGNSHPRELEIAGLNKSILESTAMITLPTLDQITAWLLRTLYLRATMKPHAAWLSSSILMHTIEATGAHQEISSISVVMPMIDGNGRKDTDTRRRIFYVARIINTWVSYEYGRSRTELRAVTCLPPAPEAGDFTSELIGLYQITEKILDLDELKDAPELEEALMRLEAYKPHHDGLDLSQANVALCIYRRLRLISSSICKETLDRIISMGLTGLRAVRRMIRANMPYWHVANVPFQYLCALLAIDTRDSLAQVGHAMEVLEEAAAKFPTNTMHEALRTAKLLVKLSKKQKEEDANLLKQGLRNDEDEVRKQEPVPIEPAQAPTLQTEVQQVPGPAANVNGITMPQLPTESIDSKIAQWPSEFNLNLNFNPNQPLPDPSAFDWDFFLGQDMPVLNGSLLPRPPLAG